MMSIGDNLISNREKLKLVDQGKDLITNVLNKVINSEMLSKALGREIGAAISD